MANWQAPLFTTTIYTVISGRIQLFRTSETGALSSRNVTFWMAIFTGLAVIGTTIYLGEKDRNFFSAPSIANSSFQAMHPNNLTLGISISPGASALPAQGKTAISDSERMIIALAVRLQSTPDDVEGWKMLGWSYFNTERFDQAASAYRRAVELRKGDADLHSIYGEALVRAANGFVTEEASDVFVTTLALNPTDARAQFFQGLALSQKGDAQAAIDEWIALLGQFTD